MVLGVAELLTGAGSVGTSRGRDAALSQALEPWRRPLARHDPGKILLDLALSLAVGGYCPADIAQLQAHPEVFGPVASDPTVSRTIDRMATDPTAALRAIHTARAQARAQAWQQAGGRAPDHGIDAGAPPVVDVDAILVTPAGPPPGRPAAGS